MKTSVFNLFAALAFFLIATPGAEAQPIRESGVFPGTMCVPLDGQFSAVAYGGSGEVVNTSDQTITVSCPLLIDRQSIDRHAISGASRSPSYRANLRV
jgi:hypothetical protein